MDLEKGMYVTRKSHNHDIVFKITDIKEDICYLKGLDVRLLADSPIDDLTLYNEKEISQEEQAFLDRIKNEQKLDRNDYFYLPGKVLHIDSDNDYLQRCLKYYEDMNIWAIGICKDEEEVPNEIRHLLEEYNPNIVVITGHDAFYKENRDDIDSYKNSKSFILSIKEARKYEKSHEKLIIIAGACQSDYEELIKAGANFASSPKRINIHALDPAIVASKISLSDITKDIDLKGILETTKYGKDGMGGLKTKGTMYIGYPR